MSGCAHPAGEQLRTVYYVLCGTCKAVRVVHYCNYAQECHPECVLAPVCIQPARNKYHANVPLRAEADLRG